MLYYLVPILILIHGIIHLMGYSKSFRYSEHHSLTHPVPGPTGFLWVITCVIFTVSAVLYFLRWEQWWIICGIGVLLSQVLLIINWSEAKFGTLLNILITALIIYFLLNNIYI